MCHSPSGLHQQENSGEQSYSETEIKVNGHFVLLCPQREKLVLFFYVTVSFTIEITTVHCFINCQLSVGF